MQTRTIVISDSTLGGMQTGIPPRPSLEVMLMVMFVCQLSRLVASVPRNDTTSLLWQQRLHCVLLFLLTTISRTFMAGLTVQDFLGCLSHEPQSDSLGDCSTTAFVDGTNCGSLSLRFRCSFERCAPDSVSSACVSSASCPDWETCSTTLLNARACAYDYGHDLHVTCWQLAQA